jgi:thiamine biosynthesis lipoprotein
VIHHALAAKSRVMMAYPESDIQTSAVASASHRGWGVLLLLLSLGLSGCLLTSHSSEDRSPEEGNPVLRREFSHRAMGTRFRIVVVGAQAGDSGSSARKAFDRIDEIEAVASDWDRNSEIRVWCRAAPHLKPVPISEDLARLLEHSFQIHEQSEGRFDISLGSLSRLWRRCFLAGRLPSAESLERAFLQTGMDFIEWDGSRARLTKAGIGLDLGGIAKGYAIDQALEVMKQAGYPHTLVDGGGDLAFGPPHARSEGWKITLPSGDRKFAEAGALATSGDTEKTIEIAGQRYSHILDPKTGLGVLNSAVVTVSAETATVADAWATACSVPGSWPPGGEPGRSGFPKAIQRILMTGEVQNWGNLPPLTPPEASTGTGGSDSGSVPLVQPEGSGIPKSIKTERKST